MTDLDRALTAWPVDFFAERIRMMSGEQLAAFVDWLDQNSYDGASPLGRGCFSFALLKAIDEWQVFDTDPGEVMRCIRDAMRLELSGAGSNVSLYERIEALRQPYDAEEAQ